MIVKPKKIPRNPGIYIFAEGSKPLYVGKALNLKNRVSQYFQNSSRLPAKIQKMLGEATSLKFIEAASEIEALIKEAELIKKFRPKYNALMRDDKNYFFVGITKEEFPRVFVTHQPHTERGRWSVESGTKANTELHSTNNIPRSSFIGPFTSGGALKETLKLLRRVFPYCTCKGTHKRPCLNSQIGKCQGLCCAKEIRISPALGRAEARPGKSEFRNARSAYKRNIANIAAILTGKKTRLVGGLKKQMKEAVKGEQYERAARLRDQVFGLEDIFNHRFTLERPALAGRNGQNWPETESKMRKLLKVEQPIERIEGYDIANIAGKEATGSMVVFSRGIPDKSQYRKFRIKTVRGISDVDMIKEVLERRLKHNEWAFPQLIVIDGGKGQLNAALKALRGSGITNHESRRMVVAALAKREEILFTESGRTIYLQKQDQKILHLFQRIRDESHRFARRYHHLLRRKSLAAA